jgi:hypothetical protein
VFETFREDIVGGSLAGKTGEIKAPGVTCYFVAGPGTGSVKSDGTTVLYIAGRNGENPRGIGCQDIADGKGLMAVYKALPSTSEKPNVPVRQMDAIVHANQNKDLAAWHPDGQWIFAAVEMKHHALTHEAGNGETGGFNNLWAISVDGNTWVQLTDFEATWKYYDAVAMIPYSAVDVWHAPQSAHYTSKQRQHPYVTYFSSPTGEPPPASGVIRPTVANRQHDGKVPIVWGERVGLYPKYIWGGALQLAMAEIVFVNGLPTLVNYRRNLTPSPQHPDGKNLWSNPGGDTVIGAGYEPWAFSKDDTEILFASDVCLSYSNPLGKRDISPSSEAFTDVLSWRWKTEPALHNITAYDRRVYPYHDNAAPGPMRFYGHWEEPAVYLLAEGWTDFIAFASSANHVPPWNPLHHHQTFRLDTWLIRKNRSTVARRITFFNTPNGRLLWAYPTATDVADNSLILTVVPGGQGNNPPGNIYRLPLTAR